MQLKKNRWKKAQAYEKSYWDSLGHNVASGLDWYDEKSQFLFKKLRVFFPQINEKSFKVIEVGTGPFGVISAFRDYKTYGVEPLEMHFRSKPGVMNHRGKGVIYLPGMGEKLPFKNNVFDFAILDNMLDHTENPEVVLNEISRVLRIGGIIYFEINLRTMIGEKVRRLMEIGEIDKGHPYSYSKRSLEHLLKNHFTIIESFHGSFIENAKFYLGKSSLKGILKILTGTLEYRYYAFLKKE